MIPADSGKLQLKLMSQTLTGMDWDECIHQEDQEVWKQQLSNSLSGIRLICVTDAAINAGGAAVYAGRKLKDSTWSCALVASNSKLMKATVPQKELSAIILGTELIYLVQNQLGQE